MCNLYTLAPWEVRHLIRHYRLIGRDFEEVMRGRNETLDVYPTSPSVACRRNDIDLDACAKRQRRNGYRRAGGIGRLEVFGVDRVYGGEISHVRQIHCRTHNVRK